MQASSSKRKLKHTESRGLDSQLDKRVLQNSKRLTINTSAACSLMVTLAMVGSATEIPKESCKLVAENIKQLVNIETLNLRYMHVTHLSFLCRLSFRFHSYFPSVRSICIFA